MQPDTFEEIHAAGSGVLTASKWPALILPDELRPSWMPSPLRLSKHLIGKLPLKDKPGMMAHMGTALEPVILDALEHGPVTNHTSYNADPGLSVIGWQTPKRQCRYWHPLLNACCHIDAETENGLLIEVKTTDPVSFEESWLDGPPLHVRLQVQAQMACSGHEYGLIVAGEIFTRSMHPRRGINLHVFHEPRDDELIDALENAADRFLEAIEKGQVWNG